jgi:hypothetical protein
MLRQNLPHVCRNPSSRDARGEIIYATELDIDFRRTGWKDKNIAYQYEDNTLRTKDE